MKHTKPQRRPVAAPKTTKATKPARRCELCGRRGVEAHGLCTRCLTGHGRRTA